MTVSTNIRFGFYAASGTGPYGYDFQILSANEFEVRVNGSLTTAYSLTGIGTLEGGTFTFFTPPVANSTIFYRGHSSQTQQTDYNPFTGHPFTGVSHEAALDKLTLLVQEIHEELSRRPALPIPVLSVLRNLFFPQPLPLKLWGWDALGENVTYYDPAIRQVVVTNSAHVVWGETPVVVPTVNGAVQLTASGVFPAGAIRFGAIVRVTTTFGATGGLSTFSLGSGEPDVMQDRWGTGLARTATAAPIGANNPGQWRSFSLLPVASAQDVVLTADAGTFDGIGAALVLGAWLTMTSA